MVQKDADGVLGVSVRIYKDERDFVIYLNTRYKDEEQPEFVEYTDPSGNQGPWTPTCTNLVLNKKILIIRGDVVKPIPNQTVTTWALPKP